MIILEISPTNIPPRKLTKVINKIERTVKNVTVMIIRAATSMGQFEIALYAVESQPRAVDAPESSLLNADIINLDA